MLRLKANAEGQLIGESHPRAVLTDDEVELVHTLREDGMSLAAIARAMEVSKSCIAKIVSGRTRGQMPVKYILRR